MYGKHGMLPALGLMSDCAPHEDDVAGDPEALSSSAPIGARRLSQKEDSVIERTATKISGVISPTQEDVQVPRSQPEALTGWPPSLSQMPVEAQWHEASSVCPQEHL